MRSKQERLLSRMFAIGLLLRPPIPPNHASDWSGACAWCPIDYRPIAEEFGQLIQSIHSVNGQFIGSMNDERKLELWGRNR